MTNSWRRITTAGVSFSENKGISERRSSYSVYQNVAHDESNWTFITVSPNTVGKCCKIIPFSWSHHSIERGLFCDKFTLVFPLTFQPALSALTSILPEMSWQGVWASHSISRGLVNKHIAPLNANAGVCRQLGSCSKCQFPCSCIGLWSRGASCG